MIRANSCVSGMLIRTIFFVLFLFQIVMPRAYSAQDPGIFLSTPTGEILVDQNSNKQYIPASTLKILTSLAVISHFGEAYRFPTLAYFDDSCDVLYIKGMGDPLFISESIENFCEQLLIHTQIREKGRVEKIVVDQSFFAPHLHIPGMGNSANPYDAAAGALCANFNTVSFARDPGTGKFISDEPQTPLLSECIKAIKASGLNQGRILLPVSLQSVYPGMLMEYFLAEKKIKTKGRVSTGSFPDTTPGVFLFQSDLFLSQVVEKLLRYSNNLIANQLLLAMGADLYGPPATIEKGVQALNAFTRSAMGMELASIAEASGLSRKNTMSPAQMGVILRHFDPLHYLLREDEHTFYKTGTLTGVRCLAGYIKGKKRDRYPFAIMINQRLPDGVPEILKQLISKVNDYEKRPEAQSANEAQNMVLASGI